MLSYPLASLFGDGVLVQRLASLALANACVAAGWRLVRGDPRAPLLLVAIVAHPAFLFPLFWIAQRSDLLLILFAALVLPNLARARGLAYLALSLLSKGPFALHGAVYAWWSWRGEALPGRGGRVAAVAALALSAAVLAALLGSYYALAAGAAEPSGLYQLGERDLGAWLFVAAARAAKVAEGVALAIAPLPAFHGTPQLPIAAATYALGWGAFAAGAWRVGLEPTPATRRMLAFAAAMALPLAFATGVRVVAPLAFFGTLGLGALARPTRLGIAGLALVAATHVAGSLHNYRFSDTGCHDPVAEAGAPHCGPRDVPAYRFADERQKLVDAFVRRWIDRRS